jgi:hypothetical protein
LEIYSSKSNEELPELKEVLLFMAWQFKKRQEETIVISDFWAIFFHKFPGIGQIGSIFQGHNLAEICCWKNPWWDLFITRYQRDQDHIHHSFKRQLVLWEEMPTYIPLWYTMTTLNMISLQPSFSLANLYL